MPRKLAGAVHRLDVKVEEAEVTTRADQIPAKQRLLRNASDEDWIQQLADRKQNEETAKAEEERYVRRQFEAVATEGAALQQRHDRRNMPRADVEWP